MFDRILFPTDGSDGANEAFDSVLALAAAHDATVHVLGVADTTHDSVTRIGGEVVDVLEQEAERIVEATAERARSRGLSTVTAVLQGGVPDTITGYAEEQAIDLIAMPTHGRTGIERVLLGSVTERVVRRAPVPVLTLRPGADSAQYPYTNVLVPTDGSDCAAAALDRAVDIAIETGATIHVLSVLDLRSLGIDVHSGVHTDLLREDATELVEAAAGTAEAAGVESVVRAVESGSSVHRTIESYVTDRGIDLVVMGTHGRTGLDRYLLGSVAEKTVRTMAVPVLTVPEPTASTRS